MTNRPGVFVAIGGPSGVGKDTLIRYARDILRDDPRFVFVTRTITRKPDGGSEDHASVDDAGFDRLAASGAFALSWNAHGLRYGLPRTIDGDIAAGRIVVANISRAVLSDLRRRYARVLPIAIMADPGIVRDRLVARARETAEDIEQRVTRVAANTEGWIELQNSGPIEHAGNALVAILRAELTA